MTTKQLIASRYSVGTKIGSGGMGTVYRGIDTETNAPIAIKILLSEHADDAESVERFIREGEVLRRVDHPNIVNMLTTVEENNRRFIIMELVNGGSLQDLLNHEIFLPIKQVVDISLELSDALARAHHLNIIHRDIKPGNVLLAEDGSPRLTDFGIAHITTVSRLTATGQVIGTMPYISPELLKQHPPSVQSDIWAFGVLIFEMLTGKLPFDGDHALSVIHAIASKPPPELESLRPETPDALVDLVYRMLDKNPESRIPSMRMIGAELEAIQKGHVALTYASAMIPSTLPIPMPDALDHKETLLESDSFIALEDDRLMTHHNLPHQTSIFVGRSKEVDDIISLLDDSNVRLVTILGPGGIGKTRLAISVAQAEMTTYEDGVFFVELAPLDSADQIVAALADTLHMKFDPRQSPKQQVIDHLGNRQILMIMDNFEHVMTGVELVAEIIKTAPNIKIIATSRERLNLRSENVYAISGISFSGEKTLTGNDLLENIESLPAVQLFIQTAQRIMPDFEPSIENLPWIARICSLVQGMPLAIELAAGWIEMLDVDEITKELEGSFDFLETQIRDVPDRHRSIRAVFDYSWQLLSDDERKMFADVSVFRAGFTREAAKRVVGASLRDLSQMVNKSLIRRDPDGRYAVHEVLRQFAEEELGNESAAFALVADQHMIFYANFLAEQESHLKGKLQTEATVAIEREMQNIRAAWRRAVDKRNFEAVGQSLESLNRFFDIRTRFEEGEIVFREAVETLQPHAKTDAERLVIGQLLARQGWFARRIHTAEESRNVTLQSLAIFEDLNARVEMAFPLNTLGCIARDVQDHEQAISFIGESLEIYRENNDRWGIGFMLFELGDSAMAMGDFEESRRYLEESTAACTRIGDRNGVAWAYNRLGKLEMELGNYPAARKQFKQGLTVARELGYEAWVLTDILQKMGWLAWRYLENYIEASHRFETAHRIITEFGTSRQMADSLIDLGLAHARQNKPDAAKSAWRHGLELSRSLGHRRAMVKCLVVMTDLTIQAIDNTPPPELLRITTQLNFARNHPSIPPEIYELADDYLERLRATLDRDAYQTALDRGESADLTQMVEAALKV
jgi:serine/threonine protein kinase/tetratricopeptide (TPR) repeat protein